jgi:hypothetical protein
VIETLAPLHRLPAPQPLADPRLDDLLILWGELSEDPAAVDALGQVTRGLESRITDLEAQIDAALPEALRPALAELLSLQRQRADEWGFSGVEYARRALLALLR